MSILGRLRFRLRHLGEAGSSWRTNDQYVLGAPSNQELADLFQGNWASRLPLTDTTSGAVDLFADERIQWVIERMGSVEGMTVLDLGPLEAGHCYMLEQAGASAITAIEAHKEAYLKCLVVKEALSLRTRFILANFDVMLRTMADRYDLVVASGILYHMADPLETLLNMMRVTDTIYIWSHFFDDAAMPRHDARRVSFTGKSHVRTIGDESLTYHERAYGKGRTLARFCGGLHANSVWLERNEVLALLARHGFATEIAFDQPDHVHGPSCSILARRG